MDQTNSQDDDIEPKSGNSNVGIVDKLGHQTMQSLGKNSDKQNEKSQHHDKVDSNHGNVTLLKSANQNTPDNTKNISRERHESNDNTARKGHLDKDTNEDDESGAKEQTTDEAEAKKQTSSSRSTIGRVIMIDGIKFVAVTCLQPPKGNCRTCNTFGSLLYFTARSCYILEAAEKFCSVQCARKFINEKRFHLTPSRQPSGYVGSNVSVPNKQDVPTCHGHKDNVSLSKDTDSGARDRKAWANVTKSKPASRNVGTLESIYVDSLILKRVDNARNHKKSANLCTLKEQGVSQSQTPPLNSRRLDGSNLKSASNLDTSMSEKASKSTKTSTSCELTCNLQSHRKEIESVPKQRGRKKDIQKALSIEGHEPSTPSVAKQGHKSPKCNSTRKEGEQSLKGQIRAGLSFPPISSTVWKRDNLESVITTVGYKGNDDGNEGQRRRSHTSRGTLHQVQKHPGSTNHSNEKERATSRRRRTAPSRNVTTDSPSTSGSNKKLWKKYGKKFRSRSCEFHQPLMRVPRECDTPDPLSNGLVRARKRDTFKQKIDSGKSLNQFHERRRSLFKTMFPFQDTLGSLGVQGPGKLNFPGEETPSETSVIEDSGDVYTSALDSPNLVLGVSKVVGKEKTKRHASCKTSHRIRHKSDKLNTDKANSNWTNLFQFMIEAADREESERKQQVDDCDEHHNTTTNRSILKDPISCMAETTSTMAYPVSRLSDGATEEVGKQDNQIGEEQRKKKKKKKKKRKRKKEKRSRENDVHHDARLSPNVDDKKQPDTPRHGRRKGKDKKRQARRDSESPSSPGSQEDPNAWPKWRGDGRNKMDMMTSIDRLMWTMKNRFQPKIGHSPTAKVNANFSLNLINSS